MTIEKLIKLLQRHDPQLEVYVKILNFNYEPVTGLYATTLDNEEVEMEEGFDTKQVAVITF